MELVSVSEAVSVESEESVEEPFLEEDEEEEAPAALAQKNLLPLMSPSEFNLLNSSQEISPSDFKVKPPATLDKDSKVPLSKVPLMSTEPPMVFNSGKPSNDFNLSLSEISKAPPIEVNLGKSKDSNSEFLLMVKELLIEVKSLNSMASMED